MATRKLAAFASGLDHAKLPPLVAARVKELLLDAVGSAICARQTAPCMPSILNSARVLGAAPPGSSIGRIIGDGDQRFTPPMAAMVNGTMMHALDFDDTHAAASIHNCAPVIPAALAAAELVRTDAAAHVQPDRSKGCRLVSAIAAGFEVMIRLSLALDPKAHYARGFHPSATCGVFGAAAAAGNVLGLHSKQMEHAFGVALSQSAGSLQFLHDGAWTKPMQVGYAAHSGLVAATLASCGFIGPAQAIEGDAGLLACMTPADASDVGKVTAELGDVWQTMAIAVKPYPSCRYSHAAMDGISELRAASDSSLTGDPVRDGRVVGMKVGLPRAGMILVGDPVERRQMPTSIVDGQFSMPFLATVMLRQGSFGWSDFERHLNCPTTLEFCKNVVPFYDARVEPPTTPNFAATVAIEFSSGKIVETTVTIPRGEPERFPNLAGHLAKFTGLVADSFPRAEDAQLGEQSIESLAALLLAVDEGGGGGQDVIDIIEATWPRHIA